MNWIRVDESLPESHPIFEGKKYLIAYEDGNFDIAIDVAFREENNWRAWDEAYFNDVLYWAEMPEPPKINQPK